MTEGATPRRLARSRIDQLNKWELRVSSTAASTTTAGVSPAWNVDRLSVISTHPPVVHPRLASVGLFCD